MAQGFTRVLCQQLSKILRIPSIKATCTRNWPIFLVRLYDNLNDWHGLLSGYAHLLQDLRCPMGIGTECDHN